MISNYWKSIKNNTLEKENLQMIVFILIFSFIVLSLLVSLQQPQDTNETVVIERAEELAKTGNLKVLRPTNILYLKTLLYSLPFEAEFISRLGDSRIALIMRMEGAIIGAFIIFFLYLISKHFLPKNQLLILLAPALLALSPMFIESMTRIGGHQIPLFIFSLLIFELAEIMSGQEEIKIFDLAIAFVAVYALLNLYPDLALRVALPLLILSVLGGLYLSFKESIDRFVVKQKAVSIAVGALTIFLMTYAYNQVVSRRLTFITGQGLLLSITKIPQVVLGASLAFIKFGLNDGFFYVETINRVIIIAVGVLGLGGLITYLVKVITDYFKKDKELPSVADSKETAVNIFLIIIFSLSILLLINSSIIEFVSPINELHVMLMTIPFALLFSFGFVRLLEVRLTKSLVEPALFVLFGSRIVTIALRLLFT